MVDQAKVTSVPALEDFRASLIVYLEKAVAILDEINGEALRTRFWLNENRRPFWEAEVKRRNKILEAKRGELLSARLSNLREATQAEHMAVAQATRALHEAEDKLRVVKQWTLHFDSRVDPIAREVDKLRDLLVTHLGKGVAYLTQVGNTLADYTEAHPETRPIAREPGPDAAPGNAAGGGSSAEAAPDSPSPGGDR